MLNDRITQLFTQLDPTLKSVVLDVLALEQQNISYKSVPRIKEQLDEIITRTAKRTLTEQEADQETEAPSSNHEDNTTADTLPEKVSEAQ